MNLVVDGFEIEKLKKPIKGYYYRVKNMKDTFAIIGKRINEKVCYDMLIEFDKPYSNIEIAIIQPKEEEEEILHYTFFSA